MYPSAKGLGYAVLEGPSSPVDWGVRQVRKKNADDMTEKVELLLDWFSPEVVVAENVAGEGSRRKPQGQRDTWRAIDVAERHEMRVETYSRAMVKQCFARFGAGTKDEMARVIAREFPELEPRLPPERKPWDSQDARMAMFDAAAFALTHFYISSARV